MLLITFVFFFVLSSAASISKKTIYNVNGKRYTIVSFLGSGVSGMAHLVTTTDGKEYVLKELHKSSPDEDFYREEYALKKIGRFVASRFEPTRVLVFTYTGGKRMDAALWFVKDDPEVLNKKIDEYMKGLRLFHRETGLIHKDPHLANCFEQPDGSVVFIDFGKSLDGDRMSLEEKKAAQEDDFTFAQIKIRNYLEGIEDY